MAVATFDTLKFANTLKAAGVPDKQAEAQAVAFAEVVQSNFKELATKEDVDRVAKEMKAEIDRVAKEIRGEIGEFRSDFDRTVKELREEIRRVAEDAKAAIDQAVKDLRRDIADLRTELKHDLATMEVKHHSDFNHMKWLIGILITINLTLFGLIARVILFPPR